VHRKGKGLSRAPGLLHGVIALGLLGAVASPVRAVTATLTDDASLALPGRDKVPPGSRHSLQVGGEGRSAALVRFDLAVLPEGVTGSGIAKATLKLWVSRVSHAGSVNVARVEEAWSEASVGDAAPPALGTFEVEGVQVTGDQRRSFLVLDVTSVARGWLDGAIPNEGLALVPASAATALAFDSKENAQGGHEPELELTLEWRTAPPPDNQFLGGPPGPDGPVGPAGPPGAVGQPGTSINPLRLAARRWYRALQTGMTALTGTTPSGIVWDGTSLWVSNHASGTITRHRATDGALQSTVIVGNGPGGMTFDGVSLWVANEDDDTVTKVRALDGTVQGVFSVGADPVAIAFDGSSIWVACSGAGAVTRLRASDGALLGTYPAGAGPAGIAHDGSHIWITNSVDGTVTQLSADDGTLLGTFPAGAAPKGVIFDGASLWIASKDTDSVLKLSISDGALLGSYAVGLDPVALAFDGETLWVVNRGSGTVTTLRTGDGTPLGTWPVGSAPEGIAFDGVNLWVANSLGNTVSKL